MSHSKQRKQTSQVLLLKWSVLKAQKAPDKTPFPLQGAENLSLPSAGCWMYLRVIAVYTAVAGTQQSCTPHANEEDTCKETAASGGLARGGVCGCVCVLVAKWDWKQSCSYTSSWRLPPSPSLPTRKWAWITFCRPLSWKCTFKFLSNTQSFYFFSDTNRSHKFFWLFRSSHLSSFSLS